MGVLISYAFIPVPSASLILPSWTPSGLTYLQVVAIVLLDECVTKKPLVREVPTPMASASPSVPVLALGGIEGDRTLSVPSGALSGLSSSESRGTRA